MRRTKVVEIAAEGRDKGKRFLLTEMPAYQAEELAIRVLGGAFPDAISTFGMVGVLIHGVPAIYAMPYDVAKPLWDQIMACVKPIGTEAAPVTFSVDDYVEEVATRVQLRMEVLELHTGFTLADARQALSSLAQAAPAPTSENPSTSPQESPPS